jgi:hypothetical protein
MYHGVVLASFSQTVGSLLRTHWPEKPARKNDILGTISFNKSPFKFADSPTILFGDYRQIILYGDHTFAKKG